jgi:serine/threonine-protein kinase
VLKVPTLARLENDEFRQRFLRESRFLVKLTHPRIVTILDVGEHEGIPYFVMQFVGGGSLETRIHSTAGVTAPMPLNTLREWLPGVAEALDFMHKQGYVHRDVKPGNILYGEHGHAYLSDFGLSKVVGGEDEDSSMTAAGAVVGTPNCVAPEVVLGLAYDGRADQYSLAMTVYEALTGQCPLEGPTASATMVNQTVTAPPPSKFNLRIPAAISQVLLKALAKDPAERFGHCVALANSLFKAAGASSRTSPGGSSESGRRTVACTNTPASRSSARYSGVTDVLPQPQYTVLKRVRVLNLRAACPKCSAVLKLQPE